MQIRTIEIPVRPTQPIRDEHQEFAPHIESIRILGDSIGEAPVGYVEKHLEEVHDFLEAHLIPHAVAEDRALYPEVARTMGSIRATATMSRDHVEVLELVKELGALRAKAARVQLDEAETRNLRRILYGLHALLKVHFAKEEEIYLPLLDESLSHERAHALFEEMERAAEEARAASPRGRKESR